MRSLAIFVICVAALWTTSNDLRAGVPEGIAAFKRGNHQQAWSELIGPAKTGNSDAQTYVGMMTAMGVGPTGQRDMEGAVSWYRRAVAQGNADAMSQLGMMYVMGYGVQQNTSEAARLFQDAVKRGSPQAMTNLANLYDMGQGVPRDPAKAHQLRQDAAKAGEKVAVQQVQRQKSHPGEASFQTGTSFISIGKDKQAIPYLLDAADKGHADAQVVAGRLYHFGRGVKRDYAKAVGFYERAVKQGSASGFFHLGYMYEFGLGVAKNKNKALELYDRAAAKGDVLARQTAANLRSPDYDPPPVRTSDGGDSDWMNRGSCGFWQGRWNGGYCERNGQTINPWDGQPSY